MGTCSRELLPKSCRGFVGVPQSLGTMGGVSRGAPTLGLAAWGEAWCGVSTAWLQLVLLRIC